MGESYPNFISLVLGEQHDEEVPQLSDDEAHPVHEEEEEDEEWDSDEEGEEDRDYLLEVQSPSVFQASSSISAQGVTPQEPINLVEGEGNKKRKIDGGEASSYSVVGSMDGSQGSEWTKCEVDGLFCPICMEAWTDNGIHQICCLPCGHIYGTSCINRWLGQNKKSGKCPQCNRKCSLKDIRKLFASRVISVDDELQKKMQWLEGKCAHLEKKDVDWHKKEAEWRNRETELHLKVSKLTERTSYLERLVASMQSSAAINSSDDFHGKSVSENNMFYGRGRGSFCGFMLQTELMVDGARLFDIHAASQVMLVARRPTGVGGTNLLTKISLIAPYERDDILLPSCLRAVRDLQISPSSSDLALCASLGKKLAILSMESNSIVLSYDLLDASWSCAWNLSNSHYVYAGLKNGFLLEFDTRQTVGPLKIHRGLTSNPVHTIHSLSHNSPGVRSVLSASAFGLSQWVFDAVDDGPFLVPESDNQGVCISLAYCPTSDDIVASYRPRAGTLNCVASPQVSLSPTGRGIEGSHVLFKNGTSQCFQKLGSACVTVDSVRLPKSTIIDMRDHNKLLASGDEVTGELILQELPSFSECQKLKLQQHLVRDVKYSGPPSRGLLGCLTEDTLQLFSTKLS